VIGLFYDSFVATDVCEMENGKWKMENGKWKMENGKWKMENGKLDGKPRRLYGRSRAHAMTLGVRPLCALCAR
jgi:hypothetical protein